MSLSSEEKILVAARDLFMQKGFAATRMGEIAKTADINKGLLHYYFKSKERLFRAVFDDAFSKFTDPINTLFESDLPLFEKIEDFVDRYVDVMIAHPYLPSFVIHELNQNAAAFIAEFLGRKESTDPLKLISDIHQEIQKGTIKPINPIHLVLNMVSMCVFPFLAKPMFQIVVQINDTTYMQLMNTRKKEIAEFIIESIKT